MISDGEYQIEVELRGGSGKASVNSPTKLTANNGNLQAEIEWSSSNYDYMSVDGKDYYPINTEGNSCFLIDVSKLDTDIPIKAETLAMSQPHMIDYTLTFDSSTMKKAEKTNITVFALLGIAVIVLAACSVIVLKRKKKIYDKK